MDKKIYIAIAIIVLLIASMATYRILRDDEIMPVTNSPSTSIDEQRQGKMITGTEFETFSGTITGVDTSCFSDGICSVTIDNTKKIILVKGGRGQPQDIKVGKLLGVESIGDLEQKIGQHANVYATTTTEGDYSLYGNDNYYVEVTMINKG